MRDKSKDIIKTVPFKFEYLGQKTKDGEVFMEELPVNCLFDKGKTGCGGTELAIRNDKPTIIAMPYVSLIKNKKQQHKEELLDVYGGKTNQYILNYMKSCKVPKIAVTYDSLPRVVQCLIENGYDNVFSDYILLADEYHVLFKDYIFRNKAVKSLLNTARPFQNVTYMSATPLNDYFILEELKHLPRYTLEWENKEDVYVTAIQTNKVRQKVVDTIKEALEGKILGNLHFFVNSVKFIKEVITKAELKPEDVKIVCSKNEDEGVILNKVKLGEGYEIAEALDEAKRINFYTSTCFEGCDIRDKNGKTYIVSNPFSEHTMVDISTMFIQICGRIRDSFYKSEITHIFSPSKYRYKNLNVTLDEYIKVTEHTLKESETWVNEINASKSRAITVKLFEKSGKGLNDMYISRYGNGFALDKNMMKLDIHNFKLLKDTYLTCTNLYKQYKESGLRMHKPINGYYEEPEKLASDKLTEKPNARVSFKDCFKEYAALRKEADKCQEKSLFHFGNRDERITKLENLRPLLKEAYDILGEDKIKKLNYAQGKIREYLIKASNKTKDEKIIELFLEKIDIHEEILGNKATEELQEIYNHLEIKDKKDNIKKAKSTDLNEWFEVKRTSPKIEGKTTDCITIIKVKVFYVKD